MTVLWLVCVEQRLLVDQQMNPLHESDPCIDMIAPCFVVGHYQSSAVHVLCLSADQLSVTEQDRLVGLRELLGQFEPQLAQLLNRAVQLSGWYWNHRYCSRCGTPITKHAEDLSTCCDCCDYRQYPRVSPCIIVLVTRQSSSGEQCLLAHAAHFASERYSTLAGFIEAGETAEQAVAREVREEVGIEIRNVRYWKSQSWPFPHSLMLAFYADYAGGDLVPDGQEILKAQWFGIDELPELPSKIGISHDLIEGFVAGVHQRLG